MGRDNDNFPGNPTDFFSSQYSRGGFDESTMLLVVVKQNTYETCAKVSLFTFSQCNLPHYEQHEAAARLAARTKGVAFESRRTRDFFFETSTH